MASVCHIEFADMDDNKTVASTAKLIIVMVGLPARGKSYITRKLARYLNWLQLETKVFNVGERRRTTQSCESDLVVHTCLDTKNQMLAQHVGGEPNISHDLMSSNFLDQHADFFNPHNEEAVTRRNEIALGTLYELLLWLNCQRSSVAIFDATNSTVSRRATVLNVIKRHADENVEVLFLESSCFDESILEQNIRLKLQGPDYAGQDPVLALKDFRARVKMYEQAYETIGPYEEHHDVPYLKLIDVGRKMEAFNTSGFLTTQTIEFLINFHLCKRQIWMTRNGESVDDQAQRIGQDSPLTDAGQRYARVMAKFIEHQRLLWERDLTDCLQKQLPGLKIWTSMMTQAIQTAQPLLSSSYVVRNTPLLNDLHAGKMTGLTFDEIRSLYPVEMTAREAHPMTYRWPGPGGEAHSDVVHRLKPMILELERMRDHVLLITHRAVMRVLLTYFQGLSLDHIATVEVPLRTLYLVEPHPYGVSVKSFRYDEQAQWFCCNEN